MLRRPQFLFSWLRTHPRTMPICHGCVHTAYFSFVMVEGHGIVAVVAGALAIFTAFGVVKGGE